MLLLKKKKSHIFLIFNALTLVRSNSHIMNRFQPFGYTGNTLLYCWFGSFPTRKRFYLLLYTFFDQHQVLGATKMSWLSQTVLTFQNSHHFRCLKVHLVLTKTEVHLLPAVTDCDWCRNVDPLVAFHTLILQPCSHLHTDNLIYTENQRVNLKETRSGEIHHALQSQFIDPGKLVWSNN